MEIKVRNNFGQIGNYSPTPKTEQLINDLKELKVSDDTVTAIQMTIADLYEQALLSETNTQMAIADLYETVLG